MVRWLNNAMFIALLAPFAVKLRWAPAMARRVYNAMPFAMFVALMAIFAVKSR